jgi:hypothetical protein
VVPTSDKASETEATVVFTMSVMFSVIVEYIGVPVVLVLVLYSVEVLSTSEVVLNISEVVLTGAGVVK